MARATGKKGRKNDARTDFEITEREKKVFDLWKEGATLRQIGEVLGISHEQARKDRIAELERRRTDDDEAFTHWKTLQLARLNDQYMTFNAIAKGKLDPNTGVRKPNVEAGNLCRRIINDISELTGVKAAIKHEITGANGGPVHVSSSIDLSKLSTEELMVYEQLLGKANAT